VFLKIFSKKSLKLSLVLIFAVVAAASCGENSQRPQFVISESKTLEASLFKQNCALCHGNEGNGKEIAGVRVPSLRFGKATNVTYESMFEQIKYGRLPMPAFKEQLTDEQIHGLVKLIMRDLQGRPLPEQNK
jgi:cytochrome c553